jgi:hypothetical protein
MNIIFNRACGPDEVNYGGSPEKAGRLTVSRDKFPLEAGQVVPPQAGGYPNLKIKIIYR